MGYLYLTQSTPELLGQAIIPVAKVLVMCGLGLLLASSYLNVLTEKARRLLSKLVFALFLPCLISTQLGEALTLREMLHWWFIPVNVLISAFIGCLVGLIVAYGLHLPAKYIRFTVVMTGIGNTGNIPLALIASLCRTKSNPFGSKLQCQQDGVAYVAFGQWMGAILVYTFVYHMLEPHGEVYELVLPDQQSASSSPRHFLLETEYPHLEDSKEQADDSTLWSKVFRNSSISETSLSQRVDGNIENEDEGDFGQSPRCIPCMAEPKVVRRMRKVAENTPLKILLQPPLISSALAIVVGSFPYIKKLLFGENAPFLFVTDSFTILAGAMIPCIMLVLGGNLIAGPGKGELGVRGIVGISVARLVVLPVVGLGVVVTAEHLGFLPANNKMFRFVLLLQHAMPTSILAGAMASMRGYGEKEASSLLFWQHISAIVTVPAVL